MAYTYGLTKIEIATIGGDGGPGTTFTQIGYTNPGTTKFVTDAGTANEKYCEELTAPLVSIPGTETIKLEFQLIVTDVNTLPKVLGGTIAGTVWSRPATKPELEYTFKVTPRSGLVWQINRGSLVGSLNATLAREGDLFYVDCSVTILTPELEGTASLTATDPA